MKRLIVAVAILCAGWIAPQALAVNTVAVSPVGNGAGFVVGDSSLPPFQGGNLVACGFSNGTASGVCLRSTASPPSPPPPMTAAPQLIRFGAQASPGSVFAGWLACPGVVIGVGGSICQFSIDGVTPGTALAQPRFNRVAATLTVVKSGTGSGTVTGSGGINCGITCSVTFATGGAATLVATPASGSSFGGWGGACAGAGLNTTCVISIPAAGTVTVTATFNPRPLFTLTVSTGGGGQGTVTSTPAGLNCPPTCAASVVGGTTVTLNPNPAAGSVFGGFGGGCQGQTCTLTVNSSASVTATFNLAAVQAALVSTRITKNGPPGARRVLRVTVSADEDVNVLLRVVRGGVTIASKRVANFDGDGEIPFALRNGINRGRAQLIVTFTNDDGTTKTQRRGINIPAV